MALFVNLSEFISHCIEKNTNFVPETDKKL